jgi:O-antigen ligase
MALIAGVTGACAFLVACVIPPVRAGSSEWRLPIINQSIEASPRVWCWGAAYQTWMAHPLLGRGTGLDMACPVYHDASGNTGYLLDAHNTYLNTLATRGALGLCSLLGIIASVISPLGGSKRSIDHDVSNIWKGLCIALVCAFLYDGLTGSFEHTRHLWVLIGITASVRNIAGKFKV